MTHVMQFYVLRLACHSCHRAEAILHLMPRVPCGGAVFALGNSGGGSSKAAAAPHGRLALRLRRGGENEVSCSQCDVVAWNGHRH